ncbi:MAG: cellulase family glycosylhydrolase [Anaerolineae bacterium]|nr:cellulase family glycosylhydrolase [Anaerolineae bacterium]
MRTPARILLFSLFLTLVVLTTGCSVGLTDPDGGTAAEPELALVDAAAVPNPGPPTAAVTPTPGSTVPEDRLELLSKGVNLAFWFWGAPTDAESIRARFSDEDFAAIHDLGFTFVRLNVELEFLFDDTQPDYMNHENLALYDEAIQRLLAQDLAVIADMHIARLPWTDQKIISSALESDEETLEKIYIFWDAFAEYLGSTDPDRVFVNLANEPVFEGREEDWFPIQERLVEIVRAEAPDHTIIATSPYWASIDWLVKMDPIPDRNIVYDFHFYSPFYFTHQGIEWADDPVPLLHDLPYPMSKETLHRIADETDDAELRKFINRHPNLEWDATLMQDSIGRAAAWGEEYDVPLMCSEFGVYRAGVDPEYRYAWHTDVVRTLESYGIGWSVWEFDGDFAIAQYEEDGTVTVDEGMMEALGLTPLE